MAWVLKQPRSKRVIRCKYCNEEGLEWTQTNTGWRLRDKLTGLLHVCRPAATQEDRDTSQD